MSGETLAELRRCVGVRGLAIPWPFRGRTKTCKRCNRSIEQRVVRKRAHWIHVR